MKGSMKGEHRFIRNSKPECIIFTGQP